MSYPELHRSPLIHPEEIRRRHTALRLRQQLLLERLGQAKQQQEELTAFLHLAPGVADRLDTLSQDLFGDILTEVERNLTYALQEILEQDLKVVTTTEVKKGKATISFSVERDGHQEDILTGQGGSVCNIISVGLRLIALSQLPGREHRRFLILDEQDCWLKPDLVPRLMAIIHTIAQKLNFQLLVISHHDLSLFREYADRIYRLAPGSRPGDGVQLQLIAAEPGLDKINET
jgi:DNA repair exonuclease SbcCD ATPase subunit